MALAKLSWHSVEEQGPGNRRGQGYDPNHDDHSPGPPGRDLTFQRIPDG